MPRESNLRGIRQRAVRFALSISELPLNGNVLLPAKDSSFRQWVLKRLGVDIDRPAFVDEGFDFEYGFNIFIGRYAFIREGLYCGDWDTISVGTGTSIGRNCSIYAGGHDLHDLRPNNDPVVIGDYCWIGANVTILQGVTIGDDCVIGAGSLVTKDVPPGSIAFGSPAKVMGGREVADQVWTGFGMVDRRSGELVAK